MSDGPIAEEYAAAVTAAEDAIRTHWGRDGHWISDTEREWISVVVSAAAPAIAARARREAADALDTLILYGHFTVTDLSGLRNQWRAQAEPPQGGNDE